MPVTPLTMRPNTGLSLTDVRPGHQLPSSQRRHLIDLGRLDHGQPGCLLEGLFSGMVQRGTFRG